MPFCWRPSCASAFVSVPRRPPLCAKGSASGICTSLLAHRCSTSPPLLQVLSSVSFLSPLVQVAVVSAGCFLVLIIWLRLLLVSVHPLLSSCVLLFFVALFSAHSGQFMAVQYLIPVATLMTRICVFL